MLKHKIVFTIVTLIGLLIVALAPVAGIVSADTAPADFPYQNWYDCTVGGHDYTIANNQGCLCPTNANKAVASCDCWLKPTQPGQSATDTSLHTSCTECSGDPSENCYSGNAQTSNQQYNKTQYACGSKDEYTPTRINFNCYGNACVPGGTGGVYCNSTHNPIIDLLFGIIRFLSVGVGIVIIASTVFAGVQLTTSRGDPQATATAMKRLTSNITGLFVFLFAYAIINYLIPAGFFK